MSKKLLTGPMLMLVVLVALVALRVPAFGFAAENETGQKVFDSRCAMCHGKDGKSDTKAGKMTNSPDLTVQPWKHGTSPAEVEKLVREGAGKMPKFQGKLSDEEIKAVAQYTRALSGIKD